MNSPQDFVIEEKFYAPDIDDPATNANAKVSYRILSIEPGNLKKKIFYQNFVIFYVFLLGFGRMKLKKQ